MRAQSSFARALKGAVVARIGQYTALGRLLSSESASVQSILQPNDLHKSFRVHVEFNPLATTPFTACVTSSHPLPLSSAPQFEGYLMLTLSLRL